MEIISLSGVQPTALGAVNIASLDTIENAEGPLGIKVDGATHADMLIPHLDTLSLIEINFKAFTDGRGFSLAYRLRRDHGFNGEIRISGPVMPDQAHMLMRTGADTLVLETPERKVAFFTALKRFGNYYQNSINDDVAASFQRHQPQDQKAAS